MHADPTPIAAVSERERLDMISGAVIGAAHRIGNTLGRGFLEKVYENSLAVELRTAGWEVAQQIPVHVHYKGHVVGNYLPDLLVEHCVLVEVKAAAWLERAHRQQCINYLKATDLRVCLLINFGQARLEVKRLVWNF
jgi:GxxExxY protein